MTAPDGDANVEEARLAALERLTMNYPIEFDQLPDAVEAAELPEAPGAD